MNRTWYINRQRSCNLRYSVGSSTTMKSVILLVVVTCVFLSVVQAFHHHDSIGPVASYRHRRIFFGETVDVSYFPFLAYLWIGATSCAGSIIGRNWILTAGHCTSEGPCQGIRIWPGTWRSEEPIHPSQCFIHPQYVHHQGIHPYDVSLLYVPHDLLRNGRATAIQLPAPGTVFPLGAVATITGWGQTESAFYPNNLRMAEVRVNSWQTCSTKYKQSICGNNPQCQAVVNIPKRIICTQGGGHWPAGTCFGDSGGPVIINGVIAGIVSFGIVTSKGACAVGAPSMQVNVVDYLPWIYSIIEPNMDVSHMPTQPEY